MLVKFSPEPSKESLASVFILSFWPLSVVMVSMSGLDEDCWLDIWRVLMYLLIFELLFILTDELSSSRSETSTMVFVSVVGKFYSLSGYYRLPAVCSNAFSSTKSESVSSSEKWSFWGFLSWSGVKLWIYSGDESSRGKIVFFCSSCVLCPLRLSCLFVDSGKFCRLFLKLACIIARWVEVLTDQIKINQIFI